MGRTLMPTGIYKRVRTDCRRCGAKLIIERGDQARHPLCQGCQGEPPAGVIVIYDRDKHIGSKLGLPPWLLARDGEPVRMRY